MNKLIRFRRREKGSLYDKDAGQYSDHNSACEIVIVFFNHSML